MDGTAEHIWNGLAGMFILDDRVDQALPLPKGSFDVPLLIADRSFTAQNQLTDPYPFGGPAGMRPPPNDGVQGDHILITARPSRCSRSKPAGTDCACSTPRTSAPMTSPLNPSR